MKRQVGEIWKSDKLWMVQFPKGRMGFKTKTVAQAWQLQLLLDNKSTQSVKAN